MCKAQVIRPARPFWPCCKGMANQNSVPNNIYTVLTLIALIALLAGVVYVAMRSQELFGSYNPMDAKDLSSVLLPAGLAALFG